MDDLDILMLVMKLIAAGFKKKNCRFSTDIQNQHRMSALTTYSNLIFLDVCQICDS